MAASNVCHGHIQRKADGGFAATLRRTYAGHRVDELWRMLTDSTAIAQWIAPGRIEQRLGGAVQIDFKDSGVVIDSEVVEFDAGRVLAYAWGRGNDAARVLRWELADAADGAGLALTVNVPAGEDPAKACAGFEGHLEMLAGALEGVPIKFPFDLYVAARAAYAQQSAQ